MLCILKKMADMPCLSKFVRQILPPYCAYCQVKYGKDLMVSLKPLKPYGGQDMKEETNNLYLKVIFVI